MKITKLYTDAKDRILLFILKRKLAKAKKAELVMLDKVKKLWL